MSCDMIWLSKRPRSHVHYAWEIWKRSFLSTARSTVHTNPSRKRNFSKTLFKPEEFKNAGVLAWRENVDFENEAFRKRWRHDNHMIFLPEFSSNINPKWPVIVAFSDFSGVVWTENIWCVFRVKTPFLVVVWTATSFPGLFPWRGGSQGKGPGNEVVWTGTKIPS